MKVTLHQLCQSDFSAKLPELLLNKLFEALQRKDIEEANRILDSNFKFDLHTEINGTMLLHVAASNDLVEQMDKLIEKGADVNRPNSFGSRPIHSAARNGCIRAINRLAEKGAKLNEPNKAKNTPINLAAEYKHEEAVTLILKKLGLEAVEAK